MQPEDSSLLRADRLREDSRIKEAKRLIHEAVVEHASSIDAVCPPVEALIAGYESTLMELSEVRGAAPFFPYVASGIGNGPWVELVDGSVKLDFISGIGVHGLGHSHPRLAGAAIDAALEDTVMQGNLQQNRPSIALCKRLLNLASEGGASLNHCLLTTSGAMANENALKIAFHARRPADRIIAFENCFAGRTIALAALTDRQKYREGLPATIQVDYLPFFDVNHPEASTQDSVRRLHELLQRYPGRHAAFWAEPVAGEGGYLSGEPDFFRALLEPLRQAGILAIFDEVQTFARLTQPFAFHQFGLGEFVDVVTVGKITQVCATLYRTELKPTAPILSQTFTGASSCIAAAIATLDELQRQDCFGNKGWNQRRHQYFTDQLRTLATKHAGKVSGPYGAGMMIAFTPGDGSYETTNAFVHRCFEKGLMCFLCGGNPYRIRFLPPPAVVTEAQIDVAVEILDAVLGEMD